MKRKIVQSVFAFCGILLLLHSSSVYSPSQQLSPPPPRQPLHKTLWPFCPSGWNALAQPNFICQRREYCPDGFDIDVDQADRIFTCKKKQSYTIGCPSNYNFVGTDGSHLSCVQKQIMKCPQEALSERTEKGLFCYPRQTLSCPEGTAARIDGNDLVCSKTTTEKLRCPDGSVSAGTSGTTLLCSTSTNVTLSCPGGSSVAISGNSLICDNKPMRCPQNSVFVSIKPNQLVCKWSTSTARCPSGSTPQLSNNDILCSTTTTQKLSCPKDATPQVSGNSILCATTATQKMSCPQGSASVRINPNQLVCQQISAQPLVCPSGFSPVTSATPVDPLGPAPDLLSFKLDCASAQTISCASGFSPKVTTGGTLTCTSSGDESRTITFPDKAANCGIENDHLLCTC